MTKASIDPTELRDEIELRLRKLEKLSPAQIKKKIAGHRRGLSQPKDLLASWLCERLELPKVKVETRQNVDQNLYVNVETDSCTVMFGFHVGMSLQEFLGIKQPNNQVPGASLTPEMAVLIRAVVDREGGDEANLIKQLLAQGMAASPLIKGFVQRVGEHPEWHQQMHEAGLYPADINSAWKAVRRQAKSAG